MNALQLLIASYIALDSSLTSEEVNAVALCVGKIVSVHETNDQLIPSLVRFIEVMMGTEDDGGISESICNFVYAQYEEF